MAPLFALCFKITLISPGSGNKSAAACEAKAGVIVIKRVCDRNLEICFIRLLSVKKRCRAKAHHRTIGFFTIQKLFHFVKGKALSVTAHIYLCAVFKDTFAPRKLYILISHSGKSSLYLTLLRNSRLIASNVPKCCQRPCGNIRSPVFFCKLYALFYKLCSFLRKLKPAALIEP